MTCDPVVILTIALNFDGFGTFLVESFIADVEGMRLSQLLAAEDICFLGIDFQILDGLSPGIFKDVKGFLIQGSGTD